MSARNSLATPPLSPGKPANIVTIQEQIKSNDFGKLLLIIEKLKTVLTDIEIDFSVPTLVVCGQESAGKSSVIERLAMLPFFPRDTTVSTRMPIELRLWSMPTDFNSQEWGIPHQHAIHYVFAEFSFTFNNGETVKKEQLRRSFAIGSEDAAQVTKQVQNFVRRAIANGAAHSIINEPLLIQVTYANAPVLKLVDLPGVFNATVKGEHQDMPKLSKEITERYLACPNVIPIVCVPANASRIRNDPVLAMVQKFSKENMAICALTKSDLIAHQGFEELRRRARGQADDCVDQVEYVALKNRATDQTISLKDAADAERNWFQRVLPGLYEEGHATTEHLVRKIVSKFQLYAKNIWAPKIKQQLEANRDILLERLESQPKPSEIASPVELFCEGLDALNHVKALSRQHLDEYIISLPVFTEPAEPSPGFGLRKTTEYMNHTATNWTCRGFVEFLKSKFMADCSARTTLMFGKLVTFHEMMFSRLLFKISTRILAAESRWQVSLVLLRTILSSEVPSPSFDNATARTYKLFQTIVEEEIVSALLDVVINPDNKEYNPAEHEKALITREFTEERKRTELAINLVNEALLVFGVGKSQRPSADPAPMTPMTPPSA